VTRFVRGDEIRRLISMRDAIAAVRDAYVGSSRGEFSAVPRVGAPSRTLFVMLSERTDSADGRCRGQSVKVVSYHEENPEASLPVVQGVVLWFDGATGAAELALDGDVVTALRTGAASGVATDLLADRDARTLVVIGTGAAAPDQVRAVCAVREIRSITLVGRNKKKADALALALSAEFPHSTVSAAATVREAVADADVICTATTARAPLFVRADVKKNVHINAIGSFSPAMCEIDASVVAAARVCVDDLAALTDAGDLAGPISTNEILAGDVVTIGDLLTRERIGPRDGITLFKSIGIAAQDWAIAASAANALELKAAHA
jgi:ornithine cyclodeaminase